MGFLWQTSTPVMAPLWKGWHRMVNSDTFVARDTDPDPTPDDIGPSSIELLIHIDDIDTYIDESNKQKETKVYLYKSVYP